MARAAAAALLLALAAVAAAADALPPWKAALQPDGDAWRSVAQELVFNNDTEPQTLDPGIMTGVPESRIGLSLFEGLVAHDPVTLEARPGVAERWEMSADGLTWTFHLREARWSDGAPLTAHDFVRSWRRVLTPATGAEYAYQLYPLAGAEAFHQGKAADPASVGVVATDARTLVTTLARPCPYFLDLCAFHTLFPVPMDLVQRVGERWTQPENFVGNGPFRLATWQPRGRIEVVPNEHYWDRAQVRLAKLTFLPIDDAETAYKRFQEGGVHWLPSVPVSKIDEVRRLPEYYAVPYLGTYFYRFNCSKPPFDDARVRQAFSLAVDRRVITDHVLRAGQVPATWFCPDVAGYRHVPGLAHDPARAQRLLAEAGYGPGGKPFPKVELLFNTSEAHKQVAESVVQQWRSALGVEVGLRNSEWKVYLEETDRLDYDLARASWIGDYGDPNTFFDLWVSGGGNNKTGWSNADYDRLLRASQAEPDHAKRLTLFAEMERILVEQQLPIMPVYIYVNQGLMKDSVRGWHENVRDIHPWQYLWME